MRRMNEDIHPGASCWIWSDLVLSALGQTRFSTRHRDEYPRSSSSRGWLPLITHENRDERGIFNFLAMLNIIDHPPIGKDEYHIHPSWEGWISYSSLYVGMNMVFILEKYWTVLNEEISALLGGIHPSLEGSKSKGMLFEMIFQKKSILKKVKNRLLAP